MCITPAHGNATLISAWCFAALDDISRCGDTQGLHYSEGAFGVGQSIGRLAKRKESSSIESLMQVLSFPILHRTI